VSRHKPISTKIKDVVIVVLIVGAVFLGWKSKLFGNFSAKSNDVLDWFGSVGAGGEDTGQTAQFTEASKPMCIVVTNAEGDHYGVKYDLDEIGVLYGKTVFQRGARFRLSRRAGFPGGLGKGAEVSKRLL
jgi:hypothetical protein